MYYKIHPCSKHIINFIKWTLLHYFAFLHLLILFSNSSIFHVSVKHSYWISFINDLIYQTALFYSIIELPHMTLYQDSTPHCSAHNATIHHICLMSAGSIYSRGIMIVMDWPIMDSLACTSAGLWLCDWLVTLCWCGCASAVFGVI